MKTSTRNDQGNNGGRQTISSDLTADRGIFLRKSSGLRRSASALDVFIFNTGLISVGLAVALSAYYIPAFYPNAGIVTASLLATGLMLLAGIGFYLWAVLLPRSGGNYVFVSRAFNPLLGFVVSWLEVGVLLFYTGVAGAFLVRIGISTFLGGLGFTTGSTLLSNLGVSVNGSLPTFIIGSVVIALSSILLISGVRNFLFAQRLVFTVAIIGTVALAGALLYLWKTPFPETFSHTFGGTTIAAVMSTASAQGWAIGNVSVFGSLLAIGWPLLAIAGGVLSIGIGAEIQRVRRSQLVGIIGAIVFSGCVFTFLGWLGERVLGRGLLGAIGFNATSLTTNGVPGGIPWIPFLVSALTGNWIIALVIGLGFVAWMYLLIPAQLAYVNRTFVAWSLDRVGPAWLGEVSETRFTPSNSSILGGILSIVFLAAYLWVPQLQTLAVFQALIFAWAVSLLGGALFPFLRKRLYAAASADGAVIRNKYLFSILMLLGSAALFYSGYILWNDSLAAGHSPLAIGIILGLVISGAIFYLLINTIRRRQGIDISKSFEEIPVE
jgi:amino acid transporter